MTPNIFQTTHEIAYMYLNHEHTFLGRKSSCIMYITRPNFGTLAAQHHSAAYGSADMVFPPCFPW